VGGGDPVYKAYLNGMAKTLGLKDSVFFAGRVPKEILNAYYDAAHAFLCVSRHEGFCVPLVEAMQADIPIFAIPTTAVGETLENAGVHLTTSDPKQIAQILFETLDNPALIKDIRSHQKRRLATLKSFQNKDTIRSICLNLLKLV